MFLSFIIIDITTHINPFKKNKKKKQKKEPACQIVIGESRFRLRERGGREMPFIYNS